MYILEEGIKSGGIGEKLLSCLCGSFNGKVAVRAVDNVHAYHADIEQLCKNFGMDKESIINEIKQIMTKENSND